MTETLQDMIIRHEGEKLHAYQDHLGYWTIGVGRLIDERKGGGIGKRESRMLLEGDLNVCKQDLSKIFSDETGDSWVGISRERQKALVDMRFQLGPSGFRSFTNMIQAIKDDDWDRAADEALNSKYARIDTPERAQEIAEILRNG